MSNRPKYLTKTPLLGSLVHCIDGSYVLRVKNDGTLEHYSLAFGSIKREHSLRVIAVDGAFPTFYVDTTDRDYLNVVNDTMLFCEIHKQIFFAPSKALKPVNHL